MSAPRTIAFPFAIDSAGLLASAPDFPAHVDQLVRQVLLTAPGERVDRPDFGCGLRRLLFAPNDPAAAGLTQIAVYEALGRWLGTVITADEVEVVSVESTIRVRVAYTIKARGERRFLNIEVPT